MDRTFKIVVLLLICFSSISISTNAQRFTYTYNSVDFKCKIKSSTVCITGFDRYAETVVIPSEVTYKGETYKVVEVDTYISGDNYSTISLTLENGIRHIANFCFVEFRKLNTVILPESMQRVGRNAFANIDKIRNFQVPDPIRDIVLGKERKVEENIADKLIVERSNKDNKSKRNNTLLINNPNTTPQSQKDSPTTDIPIASSQTERESSPQELPISTDKLISDVDTDIPLQKWENDYSFALIIANEVYDVESPVEFALRDGRIFKEYCEKTLGMPEENIRILENASHMQIKRTLGWLKRVTEAYSGICKVYLYYAGHGVPDEKQRTAYLLPTDGYASDVAVSGYSLKELYSLLGSLPAESVTVFLDACFSGLKRDGAAIVAARSVAIKPEKEQLSGKVMVFSATSESETAYSYKGKGHGMFTYFLLKKLKQTGGNISYEELSNYIRTEVSRKSLTLNDKGQTPVISVSPLMEKEWKKINFITNHKK